MNKCNKFSLDRAIGTSLKLCRKKAGLTLRQLSDKSGVSHSYFGKVENYERRVTFSELEQIARMVGCSAEEVIVIARKIEKIV